MFKYKFIDPSHMDNLFEVIQVDNIAYKIIKIYINNSLHDKFKINDIIYFNGEVWFHFIQKRMKKKIDKIGCFDTHRSILVS